MNLLDQFCVEGAPKLDAGQLDMLLPEVPGWAIEDGQLRRKFAFRDFHETIRFVNSLAEMIDQENHHPTLTVTYQHCAVAYHTHSAGGAVSLNDFICAAKANAIYAQRAGA
ncbi:4a-hydroxytetrahydrobiopterin dehydratase [Massilia sp. R2A-15]|uniref:4a-hydroxytetrahydrobiopterin dehydratase n=1 Tax=Massilia sp. R2A-15 TaxID=3064278 RepID=UPI002735F7F2|nr:4a-hydroxytetrahydrobiopterin dehydratase [Massilia sp. R2A-15]WLI90333.1 4a-hydroxytetrahydrobiopterin dehydratase [Massilia sp. R2A-15]